MATFIVSLASILIALSLYSMSRQKSFMDNIYTDLNNSLSEAAVVKEDMEEMMERALQVSRTLVNELGQEGIAQTEGLRRSVVSVSEVSVSKLPDRDPVLQEPNANPQKMRIYELAHEMGIPTRDLLELVRQMGINAPNHMKSLDAKQIALLKKRSLTPTEDPKDQEIMKTSLSCGGEEVEAKLSPEPMNKNVLPFNLEDIKAAHPTIAVRRLQELGYTKAEIAQTLGRGQGEIQLIMNLSNRKCVNH